jgi:hypothetical protein
VKRRAILTVLVTLVMLATAACGATTSAGTAPPSSTPGGESPGGSAGSVLIPRIVVSSPGPVDGALRWEAFRDAASYQVLIASVDGDGPFGWDGTDTAMPITSLTTGPSTPGQVTIKAGKDYRWFVAALDGDGGVLATSPGQEFTCGAGCAP